MEATEKIILKKKKELKGLSSGWNSADWNASSNEAEVGGGFSQSHGQAATEKRALQTCVSTKKPVEELAKGKDVCNSTLEQLCYKVKEE